MKKGNVTPAAIIAAMLVTVLIGVTGIFMVYYTIIRPETSDPQPDMFVEQEEYINGTKTEILLYGHDIEFREHKIRWTPVNKLDTDKIHTNYDHVYLIINDWDEHVDLSDNDCNKLLEFADENPWFSFVYIGRDKLNIFSQLASDKNSSDDALSFGYEYYQGKRVVREDIWDQDSLNRYGEKEPTLLGDNIVSSMYRVITSEE